MKKYFFVLVFVVVLCSGCEFSTKLVSAVASDPNVQSAITTSATSTAEDLTGVDYTTLSASLAAIVASATALYKVVSKKTT
jgi:hypothetical protein